jgi:hypothetical protein
MTREEFIKELDEKGYSYKIEGDKIIVTGKGDIWLESLTSLPPGVEFRNGGHVNLRSLTSISVGVEFNNGGSVFFESLINVGFISEWPGNITGNIKYIDSKRLLNVMIKQGMFI